MCVCVRARVCMPVYLSVCLCVPIWLCLSVCLCMSDWLCVCLCVCLSTYLTVCWLEHLSISWIACNLSSMPLLGCCAIGENTTTSRRSSVMFYTGFQFPFELSSRSACWSTSRFMGQRLGICATI